MSTHTAPVVELPEVEKHENADTLGIVRFGGYQAIVRLGDMEPGELVIYIEPDTLVDTTRPEFAFLARDGRSEERITVKRLRGVYSMGLIVRAPAGLTVGDDAWDVLGLRRYEPPLPAEAGGEVEAAPDGFRPKYDVENYRRFGSLLVSGEPVVITEKIHGANGRFTWADGRLRCGSRTEWKRETPGSVWWRAARALPALERMLEAYPHLTAYGEVYGAVQSLRYGMDKGGVKFALFDLWDHSRGEYLDVDRALSIVSNWDVPWVPLVHRGLLPDDVATLAEGPSLVPGAEHMREGVVVRPEHERMDPEIGRVQLKIVSSVFLEKGK